MLFRSTCTTSPCRHNQLGIFGTPEEAAQLYLQHQQQAHSHHTATDTWFQCDDCNKWRRFAAAAAHTMPDPSEEKQWCCKDSGGLYTCEQEEEVVVVAVKQGGGKKRKHQSAIVPRGRGVVGMQGEVVKNQGTASTDMDGSEKVKNYRLQELEKERAPPLQEQGGDDKKRKHEQVEEPALKRCKEEFIEEDHAAF